MKKRFKVFCLAFVCVLGLAAEGLAFRTGYRPSPVDLSHLAKNPPKLVMTAEALPASYDLRDHIQMPPVKNQYPQYPQIKFGTCWAFAELVSMETNALKQGLLTSPDLSEFHLAWFAYADERPGKSFTIQDISQDFCGVPYDPILDQGGNDIKALALLTRPAGPTDEIYAPYPTSRNYDRLPGVPEDTSHYPRKLSIKEAKFVAEPHSSPEGRELLKRFILENGAVSIGYHVDASYQINSSVDQSAYYSNMDDTNHGVTVVGWNDNIPKEKFKPDTPSIDGAWLVRNSWGGDWGDMGGYFYMSYEQYIDLACSYVVERADSWVNIYGHDDLGWCTNAWALGFSGESHSLPTAQGINVLGTSGEGHSQPTAWGANVFRAKNDEMLKQVAFYTADNNTDYELCVYALGDSAPQSPTQGTLLTRQSGTLPYAGYHKIDIETDTPLTGGHYFSVVVRINDPNGAFFPSEMAVPDHSEGAVINEGESYFSKDGVVWEDGCSDGTPGKARNVCIKAFTVDIPTSSKGSSGCDAGLGFGALALAVLLRKLRSRP